METLALATDNPTLSFSKSNSRHLVSIWKFAKYIHLFVFQDRMGGGNGPLDSMRSLEQFLPGDQPRGFMGPDSGSKGKTIWLFGLEEIFLILLLGCPPPFSNSYPVKGTFCVRDMKLTVAHLWSISDRPKMINDLEKSTVLFKKNPENSLSFGHVLL